MMGDEAGSSGQALRRMAIVMLVAVAASVLITSIAMSYVFGTDPARTVAVGLVFKFGIVVAAAVPMLICPILSYRIVLAIGQRDRAQLELRQIAETDQLTGLLNRRGFNAAASNALANGGHDHSTLAVLMIDIDFFKRVNYSFGHDFGDAVLVHVAALLRHLGSEYKAIAARQGGEEFVVLLPDLSGPEAFSLADRLRLACSSTPIEHDGRSVMISVSIGIASRSPAASLPRLMSEADNALYLAKRTGRNRVVLYPSAAALEQVA